MNPQQSHNVSTALLREDAMGVIDLFNALFVLFATISVIALGAIITSVSAIDIIISLLIILSILISGILILNLIIR